MTIKSQPDGRKFGGIKIGGTRAKNIVAYINTTTMGEKMHPEMVWPW